MNVRQLSWRICATGGLLLAAACDKITGARAQADSAASCCLALTVQEAAVHDAFAAGAA